jgi:hypothetical protein
MRRNSRSRSGMFRKSFVLICFAFRIVCAGSAYSQVRPSDERENDDARSFLRSVAATIYRLAWPTATYKQIEFAGFQREPDGLAVAVKLSGEGLLGDNLWLKLGIVLNGDGIKDVRVLGHNALLAGPFETSKAINNLAPGYTETSYWLERTPVNTPVSCSEARKYAFSVDGNAILLNALR